MGHKVHPNGFRLGVYRNWESKWFATDKEFSALLLEDIKLRKMLFARLKNAGVARIETERSSSALTITLHTAKPGIVIGKGGTSVDQLRDELEKMTRKRVRVTIQEIKKPELSAQLVAESVAAQLEEPTDGEVPVAAALAETPLVAEALGLPVAVPAEPVPVGVAEPEPEPVASVPAAAEAPAARPTRRRTAATATAPSEAPAKPKRAPRAVKATTEAATPKPKRTTRTT